MSNPGSDRILGLDLIRAVAAIAVVIFHSKMVDFRGGFLGVDVFFVLSGYLTGTILLAGRTGLITFLVRRLARLLPLMIVVVSVIAIIWPAPPVLKSITLAGGLLFASDQLRSAGLVDTPLTHFWTLGVEMKFYLLAAALSFFLSKKAFAAAMVAIFVASTAIRVSYMQDLEFALYNFLAQSSGVSVGAAAAVMGSIRYRSEFALALFAVLAVAVNQARVGTELAFVFWIPVVQFATVLLVLQFAALKSQRFLGSRAVFYAGDLSYGVYLWHYPFAYALRDQLGPTLTLAASLGGSVLLAAITLRYVERPFRRLVRRRGSFPDGEPVRART